MRLLSTADDAIGTHSYPATAGELIESYGDLVIDLPNGSETFREAFAVYDGASGRDEPITFSDAEDARAALYAGVSDKAIGRKFYSDRDAPAPGEDGHESLSF